MYVHVSACVSVHVGVVMYSFDVSVGLQRLHNGPLGRREEASDLCPPQGSAGCHLWVPARQGWGDRRSCV